MIIRALTQTGDWTFGQGVQNYLRDEPAIEENIATRLRSFLNDAFWALDFGIDWYELLGATGPETQAAIVLATRQMIAESYGVVRINSVDAAIDRVTRRLTLNYNIDTIFSRSVTGTVQP